MRRLLKYLSFGSLGIMLLVLVIATILEKLYGTDFVVENIYGASWCIALWIFIAVFSFAYLLMSGVGQRLFTLLLHISFIVILLGALVTHQFGVRGRVHLRTDAVPTTVFFLANGDMARFPFRIALDDFRFEYYRGTYAPMDYVSDLVITDGDETVLGRVSMNDVFKYHGYRFYQSGYDADGLGATLSVSRDPYGIALTYAGYLLLLFSMVAFFFQKGSALRSLWNSPLLRRGASFGVAMLMSLALSASEIPATLPRDLAAGFGDIYVYYNDRICPVQTLARDFTSKLYGRHEYRGMTAEQVLAGWLFFYDDWKDEPMIRIKDAAIRDILGVADEYAAFSDFTSGQGYKLYAALQNSRNAALRRAAGEANEKFNLVSMAVGGSLLRIYPCCIDSLSTPAWYSPTDNLPEELSWEESNFISDGLNIIAERAVMHRYDEVAFRLDEIKAYQQREAASSLPSDIHVEAEKVYNSINFVRLLSMICVALGIVAFAFYVYRLAVGGKKNIMLHKLLLVLSIIVFIYLTVYISLRGYISGHFPVANGYETMLFMAWSVLLLTLLVQRRFAMAVPFGFLLCGLSLLVAMMGDSNPQITPLMPVLQSPLLCIHVVVIMIAYSLFAFVMLNGVTALLLRHWGRNEQIEYLAVVSRIILYPAIFLLVCGVFIGAVWANISWGRYWGWDPKEVWALITMLVYSLALHGTSLPLLRRPMAFHLFSILAFLSVLITYFGVNFVLGGLHSYA